jgi:hypothetical protein
MAFMNLHDVFLNASLCRSRMIHCPVEEGAEIFTISDRGRFERMWVTFLYVLIEAWRSPIGVMAKSYMDSKTDLSKVDDIISKGENDGSVDKMRNVRDYMSHRDKREYWDSGRIDVACQVIYNEALHHSFSKAFLETFDHSKE